MTQRNPIDAAIPYPAPRGTGYEHLGDFNAAEPWAAVSLWCDDCRVTWVGCWDNCMCPRCEDSSAFAAIMEERRALNARG